MNTPWQFVLGGILVVAAGGCSTTTGARATTFRAASDEAPAGETMVLRGDRLEQETPAGSTDPTLARAHDLYRQGQYSKAEDLFHDVAERRVSRSSEESTGIWGRIGNAVFGSSHKTPSPLSEEARFYEAECLRRQEKWPKACDTYSRLLNDFPSTQYRDQALQHMLTIADFWLDDTRAEMKQHGEKREGKRWFVLTDWIHPLDPKKPFFDEEGRAVEALDKVSLHDFGGPYADKALFLGGSVKFFRENYKEADYYFTQLIEKYPNSKYSRQAVELAILSKHLSTGGPDYDGRKVAEARQLVHQCQHTYPEVATEKKDFLERQLIGITMQQAEKDYGTAEFYRRTGRPCAAYFCYEIVRRRYPGTKYFDLATDRMHQIRDQVEKEEGVAPPVPPPAGAKVNPGPNTGAGQPGSQTAPRPLPPGFEK